MQSDLKHMLVNELQRRIGAWPDCQHVKDWAQFSNMVGLNIRLSELYQRYSGQNLRKELRNYGGLGKLWRELYPHSACYLQQFWGSPELNMRFVSVQKAMEINQRVNYVQWQISSQGANASNSSLATPDTRHVKSSSDTTVSRECTNRVPHGQSGKTSVTEASAPIAGLPLEAVAGPPHESDDSYSYEEYLNPPPKQNNDTTSTSATQHVQATSEESSSDTTVPRECTNRVPPGQSGKTSVTGASAPIAGLLLEAVAGPPHKSDDSYSYEESSNPPPKQNNDTTSTSTIQHVQATLEDGPTSKRSSSPNYDPPTPSSPPNYDPPTPSSTTHSKPASPREDCESKNDKPMMPTEHAAVDNAKPEMSSRGMKRKPSSASAASDHIDSDSRCFTHNGANIWIVVGDDALEDGYEKKLHYACVEKSWHFLPVALYTRNRIISSGSAVNRILALIDEGKVEREMCQRATALEQPEARIHCIVGEKRFTRFPRQATEPSHCGRLDNCNQCLRAFAVAGGNTGRDEKLFRSTFHTMMIVGPRSRGHAPVVEMYIPGLRKQRCQARQAALTDESLVKSVFGAARSMGRWTEDAIRATYETEPFQHILHTIQYNSGERSDITIILLTPNGRYL